jgi:TIR domain-containing protein
MGADKIFVCYRRDDSAGHAGRLYDRLNQRFPGRVFMDVAGIGIGTRWAEVIEQTLSSCRVIVILIGKRWLERNTTGKRRIDNEDDSTRGEISTALRLKVRVVPLLVGGASMPDVSDLPEEIAALSDWQALRVDDDDFDHDSTRLIRALEDELGDAKSDPHIKTAAIRAEEIRKLMADADSATARGDWITATQTLNSVLSLDKSHAAAASQLRAVQGQVERMYHAGEFQPTPPPPPPQAKGGIGKWITIGGGVAAVLALLAVVGMQEQNTPAHEPSPEPTPTTSGGEVDPVRTPSRVDGRKPVSPASDQKEEEPEPSESHEQSMAGTYDLVSFVLNGVPLPVSGMMELTEVHSGAYQFSSVAMNSVTGARFQYHGTMNRAGAYWTVAINQTDDPTMIGAQPSLNEVRYDGTTLTFQNAFNQNYVWRRR